MVAEEKDIRSYVTVLKKRKNQFITPFILVLMASSALAVLLPSIYQSSSTILIEEQQIPADFVRSTVTGFADQRIQSLTQQILSRTRLWEIIQKFNLYPEMRDKSTREEIIEKMRDNIAISTIGAEVTDTRQKRKQPSPQQPSVTIAFTIAYQGKNPDTVQKVAGTLASLYLEQNLKTREAQAQSTTQFLEAELRELQDRIRILGEKITQFKQSHEGMLPELQQFNLGQAERLESEVKQLENSIRNAEDRKIYLQGQLDTVKPDTPLIGTTGERVMAPADRLKVLEVNLADLQAKFSEEHPDIRKVRREIAEMKKLVGEKGGSASLRRQKLTQFKAELAQKQGKYSDDHPEVKRLKSEISHLEQLPEKGGSSEPVAGAENPAYISLLTQVKAADSDIASLRRQQANAKEKLQVYRKRLEETPKVEQEYLALQRDYQNAHAKHQEVMNKILEARISEGMEEHQKGEKFTIIDPASFPEEPIKPPRLLIFLAGVVFSFFCGFGVVALSENLDHTIKTSKELSQLTGVPVLGAVTVMETAEDLAAKRRKQRLVWGGIGLSVVLGLMVFHFFFMDLWVLTAKLTRLVIRYT